MTIHDEVKKFWEENAETWFKLSESGVDIWRDLVNTPAFIKMLPDINGKSGIDVGCGDGHNTRLIAQLCGSLDAIDICSKFIALNKQMPNPINTKIRYHNINASNLPFKDETFDFAVATMSLMDTAELDKVLKEIYRVLVSGAFFQFSITHPCFNEFKGEWLKKDNHLLGFLLKDYFTPVEGEVHEWQHAKSPPGLNNFKVPRFLKPLSVWINTLINSGFIIDHLEEPYATKEVVRKFPELLSTRIVANSLIIRVKK